MNIYKEINKKDSLRELRLRFLAGLFSSFAFPFMMTQAEPNHVDFPLGRVITALISLIGLFATFIKATPIAVLRASYNALCFSFVLVYIYFLQKYQWGFFYIWSYFVVIAILATLALVWIDYLILCVSCLGIPIILGFFSPLSFSRLIHFHSASFLMIYVIATSVRRNFIYRDQVTQMTNTLIQRSKMAALGQLSAGVAHEINNPLTLIQIYLTNLKSQFIGVGLKPSDLEKFDAGLEKINVATNRITRIVKGLLNFSSLKGTGVFLPVDLNEVANDTLNLCLEKFKTDGVTVEYEPPQKTIFAQCDPYQIMQILLNLLTNAFDACKNQPTPKIRMMLMADETLATFEVIDSGPGVPIEIENEIMQPFFTTKDVGQGTGLGLSVSLGIAHAHGGSLSLRRDVSASCFQLKIPLAGPTP